MIYDDLSIILPEIFLSLYVMVALVGAVYTSKDEIAVCNLGSVNLAAHITEAGKIDTKKLKKTKPFP